MRIFLQFCSFRRFRLWLSLVITGTLLCACESATLDVSDHPEFDGSWSTGENLPADKPHDHSGNESDADHAPVAPRPAHVVVSLDPVQTVYRPGAVVSAQAQVFDQFGDSMEQEPVEWRVSHEDQVLQTESAQWELLSEGHLTFFACASVTSNQADPVCGSANVLVDAKPLQITVHSPQPGQEISGEQFETIEVIGNISDAQDNLHVYVNGQAADVSANGDFYAELIPIFGVNSIEVTAFDGLHDNIMARQLDVLWAPSFYPTDQSAFASFSLDDAIVIKVGQNFFDHSGPYTVIPEDSIIAHDLANLFTLLMEYTNFASQIPDPVVDSDAFTLRVLETSVNDPQIRLLLTDEGLELFAHIPEFVATTDGKIELGDTFVDLEGHISVQLSAVARISMEKASALSALHVEMDTFALAIENAQSYFASPEANAFFELAQGALRTNLESILYDTVQSSFLDMIPSMLRQVFHSLDVELANNVMAFNMGGPTPLLLGFSSRIERMHTIHRDSLTITAPFTVYTEQPPIHEGSPGIAINHAKEADTSPFFSSSKIQIGLNMAMINGILHTAWNAGMLEIDVMDFLPPAMAMLIEDASLTGKLPPIVAAPTKGAPFDIELTIGQLELTMEYEEQSDYYGINIVVGAQLLLEGDFVGIVLSETPEIRVWNIATTGIRARQSTGVLRQLLINDIWPQIENSIGGGLGMSIPIPAMDELNQIAPNMPPMTLGFQADNPVAIRQGYLISDNGFEGVLSLQ